MTMPKSTPFRVSDILTISGAKAAAIYERNKMTVHFQGMSKTLQFPQTIALQGVPTLSIGISPYGLYNRLNNAGRLILLHQKAIQFASAPFLRVGEKSFMLTQRKPQTGELPDDIPAVENYYHPSLPESAVHITIAPPALEVRYKIGKLRVTRRWISPFLAGSEQTLIPVGVEEFEVANTADKDQQVTLVVPKPSLVNLQEKELKPTDQDSIYVCTAPVHGHVHREIPDGDLCGVVMGSTECPERMALAVPAGIPGVAVDVQPYFCLNHLMQDLLLDDDGSFYEKRPPVIHSDYGAAVSLTFTLEPKESKSIPLAVALDFPVQTYVDGKTFERPYLRHFSGKETRPADMAKLALEHYPQWRARTEAVQQKVFETILATPSYQGDRAGALRLTRLMLNEFHFPLSNAAVWVEDEEGAQRARFLECFDYAYINPSDVDWYSMLLLMLFPQVEKELCQSFIDSILAEDPSPRYYHYHSSFVEARKHFRDHPEEYEGMPMTQIRDAFKVKGSVAHDVGMMNKGHPLRNVSDYTWYNNNYWVDLFPKLAMRVLRNVKFTGDVDFLRRNWETLKFGLEYLLKLDFDGDGVPEGYHEEVKNTFDNLVLFGADAYDATTFIAGCQVMIKMAEMMGDAPAVDRIQAAFDKARTSLERLWRDGKNRRGEKLQYYLTCYDPESGKTNTDVWTNQLDALWYLIAIGEEPFIPEDRVRKILRTIYRNNRTFMGWAMTRTENGKQVESEQGQDVYTTSNYVLAQMLDYYGMVRESKDVYKHMDKVVFEYGNSLITPDNLRAELEKEAGESALGPHYIVAAYPRPAAVWTHLVLVYIRDLQARKKTRTIDSQDLIAFLSDLWKVNPQSKEQG
jgi:uncharacterized protein (DUF608 family)